MDKYRTPHRDCFCCGSQIPNRVVRESGLGIIQYTCYKCDQTIITGAVSRDGEPASSASFVPEHSAPVTLPLGGNWDTAETWWTDRMAVSLIHGRYVSGDRELLDFLEEIESIYDSA
jgi:hypothetical protein